MPINTKTEIKKTEIYQPSLGKMHGRAVKCASFCYLFCVTSAALQWQKVKGFQCNGATGHTKSVNGLSGCEQFCGLSALEATIGRFNAKTNLCECFHADVCDRSTPSAPSAEMVYFEQSTPPCTPHLVKYME